MKKLNKFVSTFAITAMSVALVACHHNNAAPVAAPAPAAPTAVAPTVQGVGPAGAAGATAGAGGSCDIYLAAVVKFENCPALPAQAREQMKQKMDAQNAGFAKISTMSQAQQQEAAAQCQEGLAALTKGAAALNCPL